MLLTVATPCSSELVSVQGGNPMPTQQTGISFAEEYRRLKEILRSMKRVLIALSGGVDSTLLLYVARQALAWDHVLAVTAISEVMPRQEKEDALTFSKKFDVEHLLIESNEIGDIFFTSNPHDKCYLCKKERYKSLVKLAGENRTLYVIDGENADDDKDYRPGSHELGVRLPLSEAGLTKAQIRNLSKELGLPTWDKPSCACLASIFLITIGSPFRNLDKWIRGKRLSAT
jgi:uncharacterized protein